MYAQQFVTVDLALKALAREVMTRGKELGSRQGERVTEIVHPTIQLSEPWRREVLTPGRKASLPAQIAETMWVLAGRNDVGWLQHYLPRAGEFSDNGSTWRGGYGPRLRTWAGLLDGSQTDDGSVGYATIDQLRHVVELLQADPTTRRAVLAIYDPAVDTEDGKDIPCNNWLHFLSREGELDLHVATRSNDLIWGWSGINAFEWSALQEVVAGLLGVHVGSLTFSIGSLHIYDRHWNKAAQLADADLTGINALADSPRFDASRLELTVGPGSRDLEAFDRLVEKWFRHEKHLREGTWSPAYADEMVSAFPEPMLQSWLRVVAWYWTGEQSFLRPLEGTRLHAAALASPVRPPRTESENRARAAYERLQGRAPLADPFVDFVADLHRQKHEVYGDSWKRRGEKVAILANIARKVDRLGVAGGGDTAMDTVVDLLVYLVKYRLWLSDGMAPLPAGAELSTASDLREQGPLSVHRVLQALPAEHVYSPERLAEQVKADLASVQSEFEKLVGLADQEASDAEKARKVEVLLRYTLPLARHFWALESATDIGHAERNATRAWAGYDEPEATA